MTLLKPYNPTKFRKAQASPKNKVLPRVIAVIFALALLMFGYVLYEPKSQVRFETLSFIEPIAQSQSIHDLGEISQFKTQIGRVNWKKVKADSVYAFNPITGQIYFARKEHTRRPIASITKLVTALTASNVYKLNETLKIVKPMPSMDRAIGLKFGDEMEIEELIKCGLIGSHNDCSNTLAYQFHSGYDRFIKEMNLVAKDLGMENSRFNNPTGFIDNGNYSTASDVGRLASAFVRYEELLKITDKTKATVSIEGVAPRKLNITSTNILLSEIKELSGLKTGFTYKAGECLVLYYDFNGDNKLITVVLNSPDRFADSKVLMELVQEAFRD